MLGKQLLSWMDEHERTPGYLCRKAGVGLDQLISLIVGEVVPDEEVLCRLVEATGLLPEQLQSAEADSGAEEAIDPLSCLTVKDVAALLQVSTDTVRSEIDAGALGSILLGQRVRRIPREALEQRIAGWRGAVGEETGSL